MTPVTQCIHITQVEFILQAVRNGSGGHGDLTGYEGFAAAWTFVVEQDTVAGKHIIRFAVVHHDPEAIHLCHGIGASWIERCFLALRNFLHQTVKFGGGSLVYFGFFLQSEDADRFHQAERTDAVGIGCIFRCIKTHFYMAHGSKIVDFIRLSFLNNSGQIQRIGHIAIVQNKIPVLFMRILIYMINSVGIEQ
ncbi:MAG: hypothetical protein BWZ11_01211 [Bacteroidetes bacterium ADurb.BinA395]|nr:MAG: hypothetical protein BWZ11_01211 [Bacteroidetes bacterium ADurb.BinA395]